MPRFAAARLFAALLLALPLLAACSSNDNGGGGGDVDPEEWTTEVCDGVVGLSEDNEEASETVAAAFDEGAEAYHEALLDYLEAGIEGTQDLRDDIEELGAPDLDTGNAVFEATLARFDESEDRLRDLRNAVEDLDPEDDDYFGQVEAIPDIPRSDFLLALEGLGGDVDLVLDAIEDDDECAEILFAEPDPIDDPGSTPGDTNGDGLSSAAWAAEVCPVFAAIEEAIQDGTNRSVRATTYPELHGFLVDQFTAERELYAELGETLAEVGPPGIEGGDEVYALFIERQERALETADDVLGQLDPLNPRLDEYEGQLSAVFASIPESTPLRVSLEELAAEEPAVEAFLDALRDEPGCGNIVEPDDQVMEAPQDPVPPSGNAVVSGEEWVEGVCTGVVDWVDRIDILVEDLQTNTDPEDLAEVKEFTFEFFDDAVFETDQLILDLRALGIPDVENGEAIADAMQRGFSDLGDALAEVRDGVAELPEDDPVAFQEGLDELIAEFDIAVAEADDFFSTLDEDIDTSEIDAIFDDTPECQEI